MPTGFELIVETKINPKDIADVVRQLRYFTAYNPSKFGRIDGNVISISADAISDPQTEEEYYLVDVSRKGTI